MENRMKQRSMHSCSEGNQNETGEWRPRLPAHATDHTSTMNGSLRARLEEHALANLEASGQSRAVVVEQRARNLYVLACAVTMRNGRVALTTMNVKTPHPHLLVDAVLDVGLQ